MFIVVETRIYFPNADFFAIQCRKDDVSLSSTWLESNVGISISISSSVREF